MMKPLREIEYLGLRIGIYSEDTIQTIECYFIVEPKDTKSGLWEVWETEKEGSDDILQHEDLAYVPTNKLLDIEFPEPLTIVAVHAIIYALRLGFYEGADYGANSVKRQVKYAFGALTGAIDGADLEEATEMYEHRNK